MIRCMTLSRTAPAKAKSQETRMSMLLALKSQATQWRYGYLNIDRLANRIGPTLQKNVLSHQADESAAALLRAHFLGNGLCHLLAQSSVQLLSLTYRLPLPVHFLHACVLLESNTWGARRMQLAEKMLTKNSLL